ncbi:hypothetical protein KIL84_017838 [Mauremys mutica]|uniref:Uncharacterized protein n=1 Tax=Mauremys mutica TaxID=74926 RepID=A0A9D4AXW5_9SAUR|nr:hypothetical protein KIL84_017838 [Mauremys mutica]
MEKEPAVDDIVKTSEVGKRGGNVSNKPHNSQVAVTHMEKEECVVSRVSSSHPGDFDDMVMEDDEDREWFLKSVDYHTVVFKEFVDTFPFIKHVNSFHGTMFVIPSKKDVAYYVEASYYSSIQHLVESINKNVVKDPEKPKVSIIYHVVTRSK